MARKDVDLVIRARDEAAKVVESITKALESFNTAQEEAVSGADKNKSAIGALSQAFTQLDKAMKGFQAAEKIASDLRSATDAVSRLKTSVSGLETEVSKQGKELARAAKVTEIYQSKLDGAASALARKKQALEQAKKTQGTLTAEVANTSSKLEGLNRTLSRQGDAVTKQAERVEKASVRFQKLSEEVSKVQKPTKTMTAALASAETALANQKAKLEALQEAQAKTRRAVESTGQEFTKLKSRLESASQKLESSRRVVEVVGKNYEKLKTSVRQASAEERQVASAVDAANSALDKQNSRLKQAQGELQKVKTSASVAATELAKLSRAGMGAFASEIERQRNAVAQAQTVYRQAADSVTRLKAEIGAVGVPTRQMSEALVRAQVASASAKKEFDLQRGALMQLLGIVRSSKASYEGIQQAQARMAEAQARLTQALSASRERQAKANAEIAKAYAEYERASRSVAAYATAVRAAGQAKTQAASSSSRYASAVEAIYGKSRKAMSMTQRLRGEVLALVSSYAGLFAAVNALGKVVDAYRTLEAAQTRLGVVFGGDQARTAQEMDFLRRNANLLGIEIGVLANQYSKFSVATMGTNLEGDATRKIFMSVAKAARVNKLSVEQVNGTFLALEQMVSKGVISMEELRRQLGDRIPGAFQIMADAVGVSTAELTKLVETGSLSSDVLVQFADELDRRFGGALPDALNTLETQIGRLRNALFQALLTFGNAGFIESFTGLVKDLTELIQSADFITFIERLSRVAALVVDSISVVVKNFDLFVAALAGFIGLKLAPLLFAVATSLTGLATGGAAAAAGLTTTAAAAGAVGAAAGRAAVGATALSRALAILSGPVGIAAFAASLAAGVGYWLASATEANEVLAEHRRIMDLINNAYDTAEGRVKDWQKAIESLTLIELREQLRRARDELTRLSSGIDGVAGVLRKNLFGAVGVGLKAPVRAYLQEVDSLMQAYRSGSITAKQLQAQLDDLTTAHRDGSSEIDEYSRKINETISGMIRFEEVVRQTELAIKAKSETTDEAQAALDQLTGNAVSAEKALSDATKNGAAAFTKELEKLKALTPGLKREMDSLSGSISNIETAFQSALAAARSLPDAIMRIAAEQEALQARNAAISATTAEYVERAASGSLVDRIIGVESGGNPNAKNPLSSATGLGQFISSTWLRMFEQYFPDQAAGLTKEAILELRKDATISRQMTTLYLKENAQFLSAAGIAITDANLYLAHFLGPGGAKALIGSAPGTLANSVLAPGAISANASVLDGKTREQVIAWAERKVGIGKTELAIVGRLNDIERQKADDARREAERAEAERARQQESTDRRIKEGEFEIQQQALKNQGLERQAAIEKAIRDAKRENPEISAEELATIEKQTGLLFDQQQVRKENVTEQQKAEEAERRVNTLLEYRNALEEQRKMAQERGDDGAVASLSAKLIEVNAELEKAILNAQAMWQAVGGDAANAAIAKLEVARQKASDFGQQGKQSFIDWKRVGDLFVGGLTSAFDNFAKAVAEGKDIGEAARDAFLQFAADFLREIAQMIIKQAILNALQGTKLGGLFGIGVAHSGGVVGSRRAGTGVRNVSPAIFAGASRYHSGGFPGLRPGEVPVIAQKGEEILSRTDPRNILNGGGMASSGPEQRAIKIVNMVSGAEVAEAAFNSDDGSELILNWFRANRSAVRTALDG